MRPAPALAAILAPAYAPCPALESTCGCKAVRWEPGAGHVPRGSCGAVGTPEEVQLVLVCAEPGDPHEAESHAEDGSPEGRFTSVTRYAWDCFSTGKDLFHRNVRELLNCCWPGLSFEAQMRKTWITDSVLCSASKEGGPVSGRIERECATRFLVPQLKQFPGAVIVALGRKAERRLARAGITGFEFALSVAPPGCNRAAARESWARIGALIWSRFDKEEPTLSARREIVATITVYVKLKGDDFAKSIAASEAIDDGASLTIRDGDRVVARFTIERVEHWYSEPLQS